jgi:hypothetical protein
MADEVEKQSLQIALKLEGPESEKGLIRLDDFLRELGALQDALMSVDREINNGKSSVYYRVVGLRQNSPSEVIIEPVLKENLRKVSALPRYAHLPAKVHHAFFDTMKSISESKTEELGVSETVIDAIAELIDGLGSEYVSGQVANQQNVVQLDDKFREKIEKLLKPQFQSYGSVEGKLLAVNLTKGNRFYIYPDAGPTSVSCQFPSQLADQAQSYLRKYVRVYGTKFYRANTGLPFRIADVDRVELLEPMSQIPRFEPTKHEVDGPSADEVIRADREAWE